MKSEEIQEVSRFSTLIQIFCHGMIGQFQNIKLSNKTIGASDNYKNTQHKQSSTSLLDDNHNFYCGFTFKCNLFTVQVDKFCYCLAPPVDLARLLSHLASLMYLSSIHEAQYNLLMCVMKLTTQFLTHTFKCSFKKTIYCINILRIKGVLRSALLILFDSQSPMTLALAVLTLCVTVYQKIY